ncbi:Ferrichrome-iron receptor [Candidatus Nitrotoga sp. BS]|nr:Ferrichrome-iron receptor [Candidatus Nitrotoga sp. BS]
MSYTRNLKCTTALEQRCSHRQTKLVIALNSALLYFGLATITLSGVAVAKSNIDASPAVHAYKIPPGPLKGALDRFVKQEGIELSFDNVNIKGKDTLGINGDYTIQDGLNRLLRRGKLQAVQRGNVYVVQKLGTRKSSNDVAKSVVAAPKSSNKITENLAAAPEPGNDIKENLDVAPNLGNDITENLAVTPNSSNDMRESLAVAPKSSNEVTESAAILPAIMVSANKPDGTDGYVVAKSSSATKTNTLLRDVPQSVSVVTQDSIKDQSMKSIADVVRYVPGVIMSQGEGNADAPVFRGNRSTADFYVDGVRDDVQYFRDLYNIERVDVLMGPSGMIFGRGSSGGVINRVSKEAGWIPTREITTQVGSFDTKRVLLDVGQGINDVVAFRVNGMYENSGSFRDAVTSKRHGFSPTFTIMPSDKTKIVVGGELFKDDRTADRGIPSFDGRPVNTKRSTFFGDPSVSFATADVKSLSALIEHGFDNGLTVRNRTRLAKYDKFYQNVYAFDTPNATTVDLAAYSVSSKRDSYFNQTDMLYTLNTGSIEHQLLAGVELGYQKTDNVRKTGYFNGDTDTSVCDHADDPEEDQVPSSVNVLISNPRTSAPVDFRLDKCGVANHSIAKVAGIYLQDQIKFLPQLQGIFGVRYDRFELDVTNTRPGAEADGSPLNLRTTNNLVSPRVGLVYKPIELVSIYTSYSLSYVPRAGDQLDSLELSNAALKPEKFTNREVGVKWDIRPKLALTAAAYQLDRTNVAIPDPINAARTLLVKGQRTKGIELGLSGRITSGWSTTGGYTYQQGIIVTGQPENGEAGATLANVPKHTFSLWNRYDFTPQWGVGLGVINRSSMFTSTDNAVTLPGYTRVDAAVYGKFNKNLRAQLNIENLFDTHYFATAHNNSNISPGSPIAARVSLIANF